jgi:hypothetical protein
MVFGAFDKLFERKNSWIAWFAHDLVSSLFSSVLVLEASPIEDEDEDENEDGIHDLLRHFVSFTFLRPVIKHRSCRTPPPSGNP